MTNKKFILNLLGIALFLIVILFGVILWLRIYTNHGQKLEMSDYINVPIDQARVDAEKKSFLLIVNDSVHIVGLKGGIIHNQNPKGGSLVKENRKVYVTVTKYKADIVDLAEILPLYGQPYEMIKAALQRKGITSKIKGYQNGFTHDQVLEIWYNGNRILDSSKPPNYIPVEKGSQLELVLSSPEGGLHAVPSLIGISVQQAQFVLERNHLKLGRIRYEDGSAADSSVHAVIVRQIPSADGITSMAEGDTVDVIVKNDNG